MAFAEIGRQMFAGDNPAESRKEYLAHHEDAVLLAAAECAPPVQKAVHIPLRFWFCDESRPALPGSFVVGLSREEAIATATQPTIIALRPIEEIVTDESAVVPWVDQEIYAMFGRQIFDRSAPVVKIFAFSSAIGLVDARTGNIHWWPEPRKTS